jgi:hypothetical protein
MLTTLPACRPGALTRFPDLVHNELLLERLVTRFEKPLKLPMPA